MKELRQLAADPNAVRCGETKDTHQRRGEYSRTPEYQDAGYIMYYCKTKDVRMQENRLLGIKDWQRNMQHVSNAQDTSGYVYAIVKE